MTSKKHASVYTANLPTAKDRHNEPLFDLWLESLKKIDEKLFNTIERGDFLENIAESGYRTNGVYMFEKMMIVFLFVV